MSEQTETPQEEKPAVAEASQAEVDQEENEPSVEDSSSQLNKEKNEAQPEATEAGENNLPNEQKKLIEQTEFNQVLELFGIDLETQGINLEDFYQSAKTIGLVDLFNNPEIATEDLKKRIEESLSQGEDPNLKEQLKKVWAEGKETLEAGLEKAAPALAALGLTKDALEAWVSECSQDFLSSGMIRLMKAMIEGSNYNSGSAMKNYESENSDKVVTSENFFAFMREDPRNAVEKVLEIDSKLKDAGWDIGNEGRELLKKGKDNKEDARKALITLFVTGNENVTSLSRFLANKPDDNEQWKELGGIMAQELFDGKEMLSLNIKDNLKDLRDDPKATTSNTYFGS